MSVARALPLWRVVVVIVISIGIGTVSIRMAGIAFKVPEGVLDGMEVTTPNEEEEAQRQNDQSHAHLMLPEQKLDTNHDVKKGQPQTAHEVRPVVNPQRRNGHSHLGRNKEADRLTEPNGQAKRHSKKSSGSGVNSGVVAIGKIGVP